MYKTYWHVRNRFSECAVRKCQKSGVLFCGINFYLFTIFEPKVKYAIDESPKYFSTGHSKVAVLVRFVFFFLFFFVFFFFFFFCGAL